MPRANTAAPQAQAAPTAAVEQEVRDRSPPRSDAGPDATTLALTQRLEQLEDVLRTVLARQPQSPLPPQAPRAPDTGAPAQPAHPLPPAPAPRVELSSDDSEHEEAEPDSARLQSQPRRRSLEEVLHSDRTLPCPHVADNPFPRVPALRHRACHYHPGRAGDSTHADIYSDVQRLHKDQLVDLARTELLSLVPTLSSLYDLQSYLDDASATLDETSVAVDVNAVRQVVRTASEQLHAARLVATERLDTIEAATQSRSERAAHARILYGQERALTGARAPLSDYLATSVQVRTVSAHHGTVAREQARSVSFVQAPRAPRYRPRTAADTLRGGEHARGGSSSRSEPRRASAAPGPAHPKLQQVMAARARAAAAAASKAAKALLLPLLTMNRSGAALRPSQPPRDAILPSAQRTRGTRPTRVPTQATARECAHVCASGSG